MLDELRKQYPALGFALYALDPAGVVTLEVHGSDGQVFAFEGSSVASVLARAFPPTPAPPPEPVTVSVSDVSSALFPASSIFD